MIGFFATTFVLLPLAAGCRVFASRLRHADLTMTSGLSKALSEGGRKCCC